MITEDPQLEMRLRHYGSVLQDAARVNPELHGRIIARVDHRAPARPHRFVAQLAVVAAMILVAVGGVALMLRVRANELAKAEPRITSVSPADGATGVPLDGEFRVLFASRTTAMPVVSHEPADGTQATGQWLGTTLVVKYSGLRSHTRYGVVVSGDYTSSLGGKGHFEKRWSFTTEFGPPPAGVPLIWYSTSPPYGPTPPAGSLVAIDWNGDVVGMLHAAGGVNQSPDGSRLDVAGRGYVDQAGHPNLGGPHDDVLNYHGAIILVAAGNDSRARLATDAARLGDAMQRPTDWPGEDPAGLGLGAPEIAPGRVAHGAHVSAVVGEAWSALRARAHRHLPSGLVDRACA